jgi:hypothetical protein
VVTKDISLYVSVTHRQPHTAAYSSTTASSEPLPRCSDDKHYHTNERINIAFFAFQSPPINQIFPIGYQLKVGLPSPCWLQSANVKIFMIKIEVILSSASIFP